MTTAPQELIEPAMGHEIEWITRKCAAIAGFGVVNAAQRQQRTGAIVFCLWQRGRNGQHVVISAHRVVVAMLLRERDGDIVLKAHEPLHVAGGLRQRGARPPRLLSVGRA